MKRVLNLCGNIEQIHSVKHMKDTYGWRWQMILKRFPNNLLLQPLCKNLTTGYSSQNINIRSLWKSVRVLAQNPSTKGVVVGI